METNITRITPAVPSPMFGVGDPVWHVKTGKVYTIAILPTQGRLESTGEPAYSYLGEDVIWHRSQKEMEDGRFVPYVLPASTVVNR